MFKKFMVQKLVVKKSTVREFMVEEIMVEIIGWVEVWSSKVPGIKYLATNLKY